VRDAGFQFRFYTSRYDGGHSYESMPVELDGDSDWIPVWDDFYDLEGNWRYINTRVTTYPPYYNTANAWFDDLVFIEWADWDLEPVNATTELPYPNGYRYAQVRVESENAQQVIVRYKREWPFVEPEFQGVIETANTYSD
jgi:hypothetical protein